MHSLNMKQIYTLILATSAVFSSLFASAQYSGGTYTAVQAGNWHTTSGPGIWQAAEPPQNCSNCLIVLNVSGTINLNTNVNLSGGSLVTIGGTGNSTELVIGNSGASGFASSYSIILANDGTGTTIDVATGSSVNAVSAGTYDGLLTATPDGANTIYAKQVGNTPSVFSNNNQVSNDPAPAQTVTGAASLSSGGDLPIILANFSAVVDNGSVDLAWTTDLEMNSDHFTIQSSSNAGSTWNNIGTVAAAGNSSTVLNYSFVDGHPAQGTSEYRLVMVDRDGATAYSPVKAVRIGAIAAVSVYPNPATDYINVTLTGDASVSANIRLVNMSGQLMQEKTVTNAGGTTVPLTVSSYPAGEYLIMITGSDGSKQVNKILIAK